MKRSCLILLVLFLLAFGSSSWAQCPEDTVDRGECDTLNVICLDCEQSLRSGPYFVRFPMLVTHDQTQPDDSIAAFVIPLTWTHTNPSAYCSLGIYWNTLDVGWWVPWFSTRSIFRHIVEGTDTLIHNRMAQMAADFSGREWDTIILGLNTDSAYMHMVLLPTGQQDQRWWEGDRVLLATMTFKLEDTTHICIDTTFWPPASRLAFSRSDGKSYIPRHNLPHCFKVSALPDFTIEVSPETLVVPQGEDGSYEVILTSLYGFDSPCTLTVSGLPPDVSGEFDPATLVPTGTSALTVSVAETTPTGTYPLTINATELTKAQIQHSTQVFLVVTPPPDPRIISIMDVGNDQGRQVRVRWHRCYYDTVGSPVTITEYSIWRRIDIDKAHDQSFAGVFDAGKDYPPGDWDFVKTVPARGEEEYNTVCPTLGDSTQAEGMYWSVFFVSAMTSDPLVYFDSDPDSGYSLDNIPPLPIQDLGVDPNSWFTLLWTVPGEYVGEHPIATYDIRFSPTPVGADTQAWWDNAEACAGEGFFNFIVGNTDSLKVATQTWCHPDCYFAIKGLDSRPNASGISNIIHFLCGDATSDGVVDLGDVVKLINYLYRGGDAPEPVAVGDATCDGVVDIGDVVCLINYLYKNGDPPCSP